MRTKKERNNLLIPLFLIMFVANLSYFFHKRKGNQVGKEQSKHIIIFLTVRNKFIGSFFGKRNE